MFEKIEKFVSCACVSIMAVLVFSNVIARFLFKHSLAVSDEMSTYLFVLMSFMGTAIAARRRAHLGLSIITDHVSPHTRLIIQLVMYGISVLFCLLIVFSVYRWSSASIGWVRKLPICSGPSGSMGPLSPSAQPLRQLLFPDHAGHVQGI